MNGVKNSQLMHNINRLAVLRSIREQGRLSKAGLCRATHLSHPTISSILEHLRAEGFVREAGLGSSSGGRKPAIFEFDPDARHIIGVDFKRDHVVLGVLDLLASVKERRTIGNLPNVEAVVDGIAGLIASLGRESIVGVGVGVRGFVDTGTGTLQWVTNARWRDVPLKELLERRTGCRVFIDHNYNLAALGEQHFGAGRRAGNLIYINVGTGLSAALIIDGQIYRGRFGQAGEFGHTVVDMKGGLCECGRRGCLETMVSGAALTNAAIRALAEGRSSMLSADMADGSSKPSGDDILATAMAGDSLAGELVSRAGAALGTGVVNLINLFNPEMVIIGGSIGSAGSGTLFMQSLMDVVDRETEALSRRQLQVLTSQLGSDAVLIGAATLILEDWLHFTLESA